MAEPTATPTQPQPNAAPADPMQQQANEDAADPAAQAAFQQMATDADNPIQGQALPATGANTAQTSKLGPQTPSTPPPAPGTGGPKKWEHMLTGLLIGAATGAAAGSQEKGPGAPIRAFGSGFDAEQKQVQRTQDINRQQKQQDVENERADDEMTLRKHADARAQLESIQNTSKFDKDMQILDLDIERGKFDRVKDTADFLQKQLDQKNADATVGVKPLSVDGKEVPGFKTLNDAEDFANAHAKDVIKGFKSQMRYDPATQEYKIVEVPDTGPQWFKVKDADNKETEIFGSPQDVLTYQGRVADIRNKTSETAKNYQEVQKQIDERVKDQSYQKALKELDDNNGDYSAISPASREVLTANVVKDFTTVQGALEKAEAADDTDSVSQLTPLRNQLASQLSGLRNGPDKVKNIVASFDKAPNMTTQQKVDLINTTTLSDDDKARAIDMVTGAFKDLDPQMQTVAEHLSRMKPEQQLAQIQGSQRLSDDQKAALYKALNLTPPAAAGNTDQIAAAAQQGAGGYGGDVPTIR